MGTRLCLLVCMLLLALVAATTAVAGRGDPQEKLTAADNARARAIVLRIGDVPGFKATPANPRDDTFYCRAVDESDLVLTGKAVSPDFSAPPLAGMGSHANVYESIADARASWRRVTSAAGRACMRRIAEMALRGARIVSFETSALPHVGSSIVFRLVWEGGSARVFTQLVLLQHRRAVSGFTLATIGKPARRAELIRLAGVMVGRMKTAMRGA